MTHVPHTPFSRRSAFRGLGIAGLVTAGGLLVPTAANAVSKVGIQQLLWGLYYYDGLRDGDLGPMTVTSVKAFQRDRGLVVDGDAGSITQGELLKVVKAVQKKLGIVVDGDYGPKTVAAVKSFQSKKGLVKDGRCGAKTMSAIGVKRVVSGGGGGGSNGKLVVIDQMDTGHWSAENCGPTAAVISLVAVGKAPSTYVPTVTGNSRVVIDMRVSCGLSPAGKPTLKSVPYYGSDLADVEKGIRAHGVSAKRVSFAAAVDAGASGKTSILHVFHKKLIGASGADYGHYVVAHGKDSKGNVLISDPGRAKSIGLKAYSRSHLISAMKKNRGTIVG